MTAINQDFSMHIGETKNLVIKITHDSKELKDITGEWFLKKRENFDDFLISKSDVIFNSADETLIIRISPEDTKNLKPDNYYYHYCTIKDGLGNISVIFTGKLELKK